MYIQYSLIIIIPISALIVSNNIAVRILTIYIIIYSLNYFKNILYI